MEGLYFLTRGTDATIGSLNRERVDDGGRSWKLLVLHKASKSISQSSGTCSTMLEKMTMAPLGAGRVCFQKQMTIVFRMEGGCNAIAALALPGGY